MPAGDAKALASGVERFALDSEARERMSTRLREMVCGEFDAHRVLAATLAIYRSKGEE